MGRHFLMKRRVMTKKKLRRRHEKGESTISYDVIHFRNNASPVTGRFLGKLPLQLVASSASGSAEALACGLSHGAFPQLRPLASQENFHGGTGTSARRPQYQFPTSGRALGLVPWKLEIP